MQNSSHRQESDSQKPNGLLASLWIFDNIENWLAGLFELAEKEQEDAGIHLDDERYE